MEFLWIDLSISKYPSWAKILPWRAFLVGQTESKISMPCSTASKISFGEPTPMRYRGLFSGMFTIETFIISFILSRGSPTARPPRAMPSKSKLEMNCAECFLKS